MTLEDDLRRQLDEEKQRTLDLYRQIQEACAYALREQEKRDQERRDQERRDQEREQERREINKIHEQIAAELTQYYGFRR